MMLYLGIRGVDNSVIIFDSFIVSYDVQSFFGKFWSYNDMVIIGI